MSMEMSRRAKRMEKHHKRRKGSATLNMVSLMDIFTILVFFLLVNQQGLQAQGGGKIVLPKSTAEKFPKDTLVVSVSAQDVFVQGRKVADVAQVMASKEILIPGLQQELKYQSGKQSVLGEKKKEEKPVTIMGDQEIPYALLKKIMLTCSQSGYSEVSLAVTRSKGAGS